MNRFKLTIATLCLHCFLACSNSSSPTEEPDARPKDAVADSISPPDLPRDTFAPRPGQGTLSGQCGVLDDEAWAGGSLLFRNAIDFGADPFDKDQLSEGGQRILADGNLNNNSLHSEIFAFEVLYRCELAELIETEGKIAYVDPDGKKTDLLVLIDDRKVGVSVTRAFHYPPGEPYTQAEAEELLTDKLGDVLVSAENAKEPNRWQRSLLHVIAFDSQHADVVQAAYRQIEAPLLDNTIVWVSVTDGQDEHLY